MTEDIKFPGILLLHKQICSGQARCTICKKSKHTHCGLKSESTQDSTMLLPMIFWSVVSVRWWCVMWHFQHYDLLYHRAFELAPAVNKKGVQVRKESFSDRTLLHNLSWLSGSGETRHFPTAPFGVEEGLPSKDCRTFFLLSFYATGNVRKDVQQQQQCCSGTKTGGSTSDRGRHGENQGMKESE